VPETKAPWLEIHLTDASISFIGDEWSGDDPASIFVLPRAAGTGALTGPLAEGWNHGLTPPPPPDDFPLIGRGVGHFIAVIAGEEKSILTAEHARHVLEIVLLAYESIADGRTHELETTF
jgi:predicted dehydrogenase